MMNLRDKALRIEQFIDEHFVDDDGLVYTFLDKTTKVPPEEQLFADAGERQCMADFSVPGFTRRDVAMYENCGMTTGAYLIALMYRYKVEKKTKTLDKARRCYNALKHIFELGKELETGFFPKTYGGRFSDETSTDQCLYAIYSMNAFYEFASPEEKKEIDYMIPAIADFWRKRKYIYNYWEQKNMQWPVFRFPIFMLLAYRHSGDKKFKDEYERLLSDWDVNYPHQFNLLGNKQRGLVKPNEYEKKYNAWIVSSMPDYFTMRMIELEYYLSNDPENSLAPHWKQSVIDMWEQAKLVLTPDGKVYQMLLVDMETSRIYRPDPCELRTSIIGWGTMIARAAVQAMGFYPANSEINKTILNIMNDIDIEDMTYFEEPERFPANKRFQTRFLSGDAITNWLWAYWQGIAQNIF